MAEGKKSFVAYSDWKNIFDELPDEDAGKLIKHIFSYVNDEKPQSDSVLIKAVFANIKATLKRDLDRWEKQLKQRSEAGKLSAEKRSTKFNDRSTVVDETVRNPTVSVSVSVSDSVNDVIIIDEIIEKLLTQKIWCDSICIKHGLKNHSEINPLLKKFKTHLESTKEIHKKEKYFIQHFNNWIVKQKSTSKETSIKSTVPKKFEIR